MLLQCVSNAKTLLKQLQKTKLISPFQALGLSEGCFHFPLADPLLALLRSRTLTDNKSKGEQGMAEDEKVARSLLLLVPPVDHLGYATQLLLEIQLIFPPAS